MLSQAITVFAVALLAGPATAGRTIKFENRLGHNAWFWQVGPGNSL